MILTHQVLFSFFNGASNAAAPPPPPAPAVGPGSGGGSISRVFGHYPELDYGRQELKQEIKKLAKKKKRVELNLQFAKGQSDLDRLLKSLNTIQEKLAVLTEKYREIMNTVRLKAIAEAEEEVEFMDLLMKVL